MHYQIPCTIMRGGTSKGLYLMASDLPEDRQELESLLLRLMGSPDLRQIDGLGGATSVTSKAAIIAVSDRPDADVDYTFAQVSVDKPVVSFAGNCGNISSGVGPFAIESGLVKARDGVTEVRIFNTNTKKVIVAQVQTPGGKVCYDGDYAIAGVPGRAAPVKLSFREPAGSLTGKLLPTGNALDVLAVEGVGEVPVSIVDAANPLVFVRAESMGMTGRELPDQIKADRALLDRLEAVRSAAAVRLGFIDRPEDSRTLSPGVPKMTIVAPAQDYVGTDGALVRGDSVDILGRMMSMQLPHETYALTGLICTVCAAEIPGTIVHSLARDRENPETLRIGHPCGVSDCGVEDEEGPEGQIRIRSAYSCRTARLLMKGTAFV